MKTIRLLIPQWKGGVNPDYAFGANILAKIAPITPNQPLIKVSIQSTENLEEENGIIAGDSQFKELKEIFEICKAEAPDKIIIFGGDCSVSQGPFDYLSQKYGSSLGIVWLDSHPDISNLNISNHNHEFVLASIMGLGNSLFSKAMKNPVSPSRVIYAGIVEDPAPKEKLLSKDLHLSFLKPEEIIKNTEKFKSWIETNKISKLCVHFDLDVLTPEDFRSLTSSKPYQTSEEYGAAIGKLKLREVVEFLNNINQIAEIVGLSIAEFIPWDLINLRNALSDLPIFK